VNLKTLIATIEADIQAVEHIAFFKAAARQVVGNGIDKAYQLIVSTATEAVVVEDVNAFVESATKALGPEMLAFDKLAEMGIDNAIDVAFAELGKAATADQIKAFVFAHLGLA
jgi:hypothetical protein